MIEESYQRMIDKSPVLEFDAEMERLCSIKAVALIEIIGNGEIRIYFNKFFCVV